MDDLPKKEPSLDHNPYVGSFVYSSPSEPLTTAEVQVFNQDKFLQDAMVMFRNHPILGYFRHSDPSKTDTKSTQTATNLTAVGTNTISTQTTKEIKHTRDVGVQVDVINNEDFLFVSIESPNP